MEPWAVSFPSRALFPRTQTRGSETLIEPLYTEEERARRDRSPWTMVQGVLAPVQLLVMVVSAYLVLSYLRTDVGYEAANVSVVVKTLILYLMMFTGSLWEHDVFGQYLFARPFLVGGCGEHGRPGAPHPVPGSRLRGLDGPAALMVLALVAYAAYAINALQFLLKLRRARAGVTPRYAS